MDTHKRGHSDAGSSSNFNVESKRPKQEMGSISTGLRSKPKPCSNFFSTNGCPLGDNCRFLHYEPGGHNAVAKMTNHETQTSSSVGSSSGREDPEDCVSSFGASVTTKILLDAPLTGAIIGKGGNRTKQICHETGVKLSIVDHERDPHLKNVEGNYDQINEAKGMVRGLRRFGSDAAHPAPRNPYKSELCEKFASGKCKYGGRCHFAHGVAELRRWGD